MKSEREVAPKSRGWSLTRIELLVVVSVVGILIAILLPAVQQVRTAAKRAQSANNLRQIALGALNYESANMRFPVCENRIKSGAKNFGWGLTIFPFLESNNIFARVDENEPWDSIENSFVISQDAYSFVSPFEEHNSYNMDGFGVLHYAACSELISGGTGVHADEDFEWSQFMFGEICDGYEPWAKPGSCRSFSNGIRFDTVSFGSPSGEGALMARADGGVEFVGSTFSRPAQTFEGKREQGASGQPDRFVYELTFAYSPTVKGWQANCWFSPNSKGYGGGKALNDEGLKRIIQHDNLFSLILGGAHQVTGDGLKSLHDSSLTRLNIGCCNPIKDEDLKMLHKMTGLNRLTLKNGEFSSDSIEELRQALPDCEIVVR